MALVAEEGGEEAHSHFGPAWLARRRVAERGLFPLLCAKAELCAQNEMASSLALSRPSDGGAKVLDRASPLRCRSTE